MRGFKLRYKILVVMFVFCTIVSQGCQKENAKILVILPSALEASYSTVQAAAQEWGEQENVQVTVMAPNLSTALEQQKLLEEQLDQNWDAICIEPLGTDELSPLLEYASDQGTVIVTMFGDIDSADYNIEPFSLKELGAQMMIALGDDMSENGLYMTMVPSADNKKILDIEAGAVNEQKGRYADLIVMPRLYESQSAETAAEAVAQARADYMIAGVLFFSAAEGRGIASWQQSAGEDIVAVGLADENSLSEEVSNGTLDAVFYWDESNLLLAAMDIAMRAADGNGYQPEERISLSYEGYENMRYLEGNTWHANDIRSLT